MKGYKPEKRKYKFLALIICFILTVMVAIGGTLAYLFTDTEPVVNTFTPVEVDIEIVEKLEENIKRDVQVANTGSTDVYIRAKVVVTWQNDEGNVYSTAPDLDNDYSISFNENDWILAEDGFRYCKVDVASNELSPILITEAKPLKVCENVNYTLHIEILSQAIQSTPDEAVDVWDSLVKKGDGTIRVNVEGNNGTLTVEWSPVTDTNESN